MSILKIRRNEPITTATADIILARFSDELDIYVGQINEDTKRSHTEVMLCYYSTYSYIYLSKVGITLKPDNEMKDTMSYMNSVLAEILHEQGIAYFHPEEGYSIVDKCISYFLDNGEDGFYENLATVIEDMKPVVEDAVDTDEEFSVED